VDNLVVHIDRFIIAHNVEDLIDNIDGHPDTGTESTRVGKHNLHPQIVVPAPPNGSLKIRLTRGSRLELMPGSEQP